MTKVIRSIEVNEFFQEVKLTFSGPAGVNLMEILTLQNPDGAVSYEALSRGFEVLGSYGGQGLTLGRKDDFHITFASASSGISHIKRTPRAFAWKYWKVSFPGIEA